MTESDAVIPRCSKCGYQRPDPTMLRCSECGDQSETLRPLDRTEIWRGLRRLVLLMLLNATMSLAPAVIAWLGVAAGAIPLFMCGVMLLLFVIPWACVIVAAGISLHWTHWLLLARWSRRGDDIGPWSGRSKHALAFATLLTGQLIICGAFAGIGLAVFPGYPAGWP